MLLFFIFILSIINTYFIYKLYISYTILFDFITKKSFDNVKIEDMDAFKDFFDINDLKK